MVLSREDLYIHLSVLISEVMKNGWATLTLYVTSHNFSCLILACLLCCSRLMSAFFNFLPVLCLGICVELDVDIITTPSHVSFSLLSIPCEILLFIGLRKR